MPPITSAFRVRLSFLFALMLFQGAMNAQSDRDSSVVMQTDKEDNAIFLYGTVYGSDKQSAKVPLADAAVILLYSNGSRTNDERYVTDSTGKFSFTLDYDYVYAITFMKLGHYTKILEIVTFHVPLEEREAGGFAMSLDIHIPPATDRRNKRLLEKKVLGKCSYDITEHNFRWDVKYTEKFTKRLERKHWWWPW